MLDDRLIDDKKRHGGSMRSIIALACIAMLSCKTTRPVSTLKVVGAQAAVTGSFSSVIYLGTCSAVRVGQYFYLTAKHCVQSNGWQEEGEVDGRLIYQNGPQHVFLGPITKIYEHDVEDLAILKIMFEDPPVGIATIGSTVELDERVIISGYGCTQLYESEGTSYPDDSPGYLQVVSALLYQPPGAGDSNLLYVKGKGRISLGETKVTGPSLCPGESGGGLWKANLTGIDLIGINNRIDINTLVSTFTRVDRGIAHEWLKGIVGSQLLVR